VKLWNSTALINTSTNDPRRFLEGFIDEVSIYNRALSINEIEQNMVALGIAVEPASKKLAITWGKMKISD
jgi:hypothetical protein